MNTPLDRKVAIITGASSGIGAALAERLARDNWKITLAARRIERLEQVASKVVQLGGQALVLPTDVGNLDDQQKMVQATLDTWGGIDVLVNNAGLSHNRFLIRTRPEWIRTEIQTNLVAVIECSRAVLPTMLRKKSGHIVNVASLAGFVATPGGTIYGASKFGVIGFSDALRRELRGSGIHVSAFCPGFTPSELSPNLKGLAEGQPGVRRPPGLMPVSYVADQAAWLIRHPRRRLIIPRTWKLLVLVATLFPGIPDAFLPALITLKNKGIK